MAKSEGKYTAPAWESKEETDRRRERERRRDEILDLIADELGELVARVVDERLALVGGRENAK
jgi:hypothetical protein